MTLDLKAALTGKDEIKWQLSYLKVCLKASCNEQGLSARRNFDEIELANSNLETWKSRRMLGIEVTNALKPPLYNTISARERTPTIHYQPIPP